LRHSTDEAQAAASSIMEQARIVEERLMEKK